jgi:hypothetical protein
MSFFFFTILRLLRKAFRFGHGEPGILVEHYFFLVKLESYLPTNFDLSVTNRGIIFSLQVSA